jgi:O-antigen/teichoic acid export membrane protein
LSKIAKQSLLTTLFAYVGVVIGYFNVLWLLPFVLAPEEIGLFKTIQDMAILLVPFAQLGIGNGITRFFPRVTGSKFPFFTFTIVIGVIGFILVAIGFFLFKEQVISIFAENSPEVNNFLLVALLITFFSVLNTILDAFSRSYLKVAIPSFFRDVLLRLLVSFLIIGYYFDLYTFYTLMWGLGGIYFLTLLAMIAYMAKIRIFQLSIDWGQISTPFKKEFLQYSLITLLGTAGALLIMKIDSLMVSSMIGLNANAIYTIGFSIAVVIEMPRRAISQVIMPVISEKFANNQLQEINVLYKKIAIHQFLICLLIFLLIWVNIDSLYHYVPNREIYQAGKWVVFLIGLGKLSDVIFSVNGEIIVFSRFYLFNITATLIMCVAVIMLNLWLIPVFGIEGAAMASLLAMFLYNLIKYVYVKIRLGFDPFTWGVGKILLVGIGSWGITHYALPVQSLVWLDILIRSGVMVLLYGLGAWSWHIAPEVEKWVKEKSVSLFSKV